MKLDITTSAAKNMRRKHTNPKEEKKEKSSKKKERRKNNSEPKKESKKDRYEELGKEVIIFMKDYLKIPDITPPTRIDEIISAGRGSLTHILMITDLLMYLGLDSTRGIIAHITVADIIRFVWKKIPKEHRKNKETIANFIKERKADNERRKKQEKDEQQLMRN